MEGSHREQISLVEKLPAPPPGVVFLLSCGILLDSLLAELSRIGAHILLEQFTLDRRALKTLFNLASAAGIMGGPGKNDQIAVTEDWS